MSGSASQPDYSKRLLASQPRLRTYVRSIVFDPGDLDRLLQEIASTASASFKDYDPKQSFDAWLMGVARNCVLLFLDNPRTRPKGLRRETLIQLEAISFQNALQAEALQDALEHCLPRLGKTEAVLMAQRFKKGGNNDSVAKVQKVNPFTVSHALNQVLAQLLAGVNQASRGGSTGAES